MEKECYLVINVIISCEGVNKKAVFFIKYEIFFEKNSRKAINKENKQTKANFKFNKLKLDFS